MFIITIIIIIHNVSETAGTSSNACSLSKRILSSFCFIAHFVPMAILQCGHSKHSLSSECKFFYQLD